MLRLSRGPYRGEPINASEIPKELKDYIEDLREKYSEVLDTYEAYGLLQDMGQIPFFENLLKEFSIQQLQEAASWDEADLTICLPGISFDDLIRSINKYPQIEGQQEVYTGELKDKREPIKLVANIVEGLNSYHGVFSEVNKKSNKQRMQEVELYNVDHDTLPLHRLVYTYALMNLLRQFKPKGKDKYPLDRGIFLNAELPPSRTHIPYSSFLTNFSDMKSFCRINFSENEISEIAPYLPNDIYFRRVVGKDIREFLR